MVTPTNTSQVAYPLVRHIINASKAETDQLVAILVDAFQGDPFTDILLGGDLSLSPLELRANVQAALIGGEVHALSIGPESANIVGVSIWYPPGKSAFSSEEQRAAGWDQFLETIPKSLREWWLNYFIPTVSNLSTTTLGEGYLRNSWHLHLFGVLKAHQGQGYGRALFNFAHSRAKESQSPMVLETTTDLDVKIYTKFGFKVCAKTEIDSNIGREELFLMVKETRS